MCVCVLACVCVCLCAVFMYESIYTFFYVSMYVQFVRNGIQILDEAEYILEKLEPISFLSP